jgi:hypothetical protein
MRDYRAYILGINGGNGFVRVTDFSGDHPDDAAAIEAAKKLDNGHDVELWDCKRLVARIDHKSHSATICDDPLTTILRQVPNESLAPAIEGETERAPHSPEGGGCIGEEGEPSKVTPSPLFAIEGDNGLQQGHDRPSSPSQAALSASLARRHSLFFPFSLWRAEPQLPTASALIAPHSATFTGAVTFAAVEAQTARVDPKRASHARRRLAASSIATTLVAAAFTGMYFRTEVASHVARYASLQDIVGVGTIDGQVVQHVSQTQLSPTSEVRESSQNEPSREVLAKELAEARRAIDELNLKLRAEAVSTAQSLGQEREKAAALKQATESTTAELRQSLQQEHDRAEALATELAKARRATEQKPATAEERPGINSSDCTRYRSYDPASRTYRAYSGQRRSCP